MVRRMTSWWGWALRRARASTGLLLTLLALVTATTAILAGAVGYSGAAATTAAREAITGAVPQEAGIRVQTRQAEDPQAQDAAARERIDAAFSPAPITVQRTVVTPPRPVTVDGERVEGDLVALSSESLTPDAPDVDERVDVVEGTWPEASTDGGPVQGLLHAAAAQEWDVSVGETVDVGGVPVTVVGLWRPVDPDDAYWFGDRLVATGREDGQRGPLVVDPGAAGELVDAPFVRWTVQPDAREIQPDDLAHLASAAESLRSSLKTPEVEVRGVTVDGDLAPTAATAATNLATANALGVIPLSVLALVTLLSVVQLARLLSTTREAQAQLLVARGATRAQVLVSTLAESAVVTVLGSTFGGLIAWGVLRAVPAGSGQTATVLQVAAVTGLAVLVVLAAVAVLQARRLTAGGTADLSGRTRAATALATLVLVLGAAGVAWWQLGRTGSPLVTREDGTLGTDLVAGAAPALLLAAAAVVAMALLGPLGRLVEALTRPGRSAVGHLASAQVARRLPVYAVPAVLTVLAVGATTLSGLYAGTSAALRDNLTAVGQGAPVRATLEAPPKVSAPGVVPPGPQVATDVAGVAASAPVWLDPKARMGDLDLPVTMAPAEELAAVITAPSLPGGQTLVPVERLSGETVLPQGVEVPDGASEIEVELDVALGITEQDLAALQSGFEQSTKDMVEGLYGEPAESEQAARDMARTMTDSMLESSTGQVEWQVALLLVDRGTGLFHEVGSSPVDVTLPTIVPPWVAAGVDPQAGPVTVPDVDYTTSEVTDGGGTATLVFTLPEGSDQTLVGVRLTSPTRPDNWFGVVPPTTGVELTARTDEGTALFGEATAGWGSQRLATPEVVADLEEQNAGIDPSETVTTILPDGSTLRSSAALTVPGELDTTGPTWTVEAPAWPPFPDDFTVGPGLSYQDETTAPSAPTPGDGAEPGTSGDRSESAAVPVALTSQAARDAVLAVGDRAVLDAFGARLPVEVAAVVPAVPGELAPVAALVDRDAVAAWYAGQHRTLPFPSELWAMPSGWEAPEPGARHSFLGEAPGADEESAAAATAVVEELAAHEGIDAVTGPGRVSVTDATQAARLVFWVASAGAVLLAVTGIAAVAATLLGNRRPEVAVLRALGMPPRAQARSRALELGGVVLASVVLGLGASWLVGRAVVPELARSTTARDQVTLPAGLLLEPGVWAVLLGVGLLAVLLVVVAQAGRVRAQALDHDYREEIR